MKTTTFLQIDGKKLDFANQLTTLTTNTYNSEATANIKLSGYNGLASTMFSLIGVCQTALQTFKENHDLSETEKEQKFGASSQSIIEVLEIAKNLIPFNELELIEQIRQISASEQSK